MGRRHYSNTVNKIEYDKLNPKTKKLVKVIKGTCSFCGCKNSQIFTKKMTRGEDSIKIGKCTHGHRSYMSSSAWCDLDKNYTVLKLHDMCHNPKCKCQKQITFSSNKFQLEDFEYTMRKIFKGSQTAWNKFLRPTINTLAPVKVMAVVAKSKNKQIEAATSNILKSLTGGKILSLTDMHSGAGLRLRVMWNHFN